MVEQRAKRRTREPHPDDVEAYTDHEEPTIRDLTDRAHREGYDDRVPEL